MEQKCFLASFAHPDDEAFGVAGLFRGYADSGIRTALICATRGEEGEISDPALATKDTLGQVREQELREACRIMGVEDLTFLDYRDGSLGKADPSEVEGRIVRVMRRLRPQVVVTFDKQGGYGHPDHIAIHARTVGAFHKAGDARCYPEQIAEGLQPYAPQKLYVTALPVSGMRAFREKLREQGVDFRPGGAMATIPIERMGTPDDEVTTAVPLNEREIDAKLAAMLAHRTQMDPRSPMSKMSRDDFRDWRGVEHFVQIYPEGAPGGQQEHDLFAGVRL